MERLQRFSIRKLSIGAVSCVIGTVAFFSYSTEVKAAENTDPSLKIVEINKANNPATSDVTVDNTNKQAVVNTSDQSKSDDSSAVASTSERNQLQTSQDSSIKVKENNLNTDKSDTPKAVVQPTSLNDENKLRDPDSKDVEVKPKESSNVDTNEQKETSTVLSKQPANADTQLAATTSGVQPFMNLAVVSDNNDLTPKRETVDSTWTLHYVNQADHKQELKDPTVITMQYERTNTPQSDGKIQYGDWSYVPGSFKQTGTPITVKDSDNPVKQDNVDKNGENFDVFTITAMYPTVAGYGFYNGINGTRLHDNLRNNERQADAMSKDFYAEYDVAKERSVTVKFVDDQSFDPDVSGGKAQVGQAITLTGRDGDTVKVNVTVPDKYQLANGQQLPTTYTFTAGSGDVTIHLVHKVVQREATIDVQLAMMTGVNLVGVGDAVSTIPQTRWEQLDDSFKHGVPGPDDFDKVFPSVEVGTLTGHVNYDVVDNSVVSLGDDWTTLNLGGHTYQLPNGDDVVNGVLMGDETSWGQSFRKAYLTENPNADPDYVTRPWHGYLSVNATNGGDLLAQGNFLGLQGGLSGNESNALAKANGDRAATAVEMANKTIDTSFLEYFDDTDFSERDGHLQSILSVPVLGVYVPYVEKTATRTINVTTPDGKTTTVKQTATLEKQVDLRPDAHQSWTTGEWANYDVPTIPGYTASQSNVAKETVMGATKDQTVNITYTANPQTTTVVYQTEDGTLVHTTTVNGQTGQTVKVSNEVPAGWMITKGQVPSEITFGPNGIPQTVITIAHQHVTVDSDHPQNNGTKLPDNPGKTFSGVEVNDLNKTITRTIKVTTPDGQTKTIEQTAKLTRTADVDEVTGKVKYSDWTTGNWSAYTAPSVTGYTASQSNVAQQAVTDATKDQTIDITYTANDHQISVEYVDNATGQVLKTDHLSGKTGQTVSITPHVPDGWELVSGQSVPSEVTLGADGVPATVIKVQPQERSVTVKFVDDQSFDWYGTDYKKQVGQAVTVTGRDGDTVDLKLTVPDKYQLADGQQLPTTYTFKKGSGDLAIHLKHQVVQREATIDVKLALVTIVPFGDNGDDHSVITQAQWNQLDDELKRHVPGPRDILYPFVKVGTLTGHVGYDLVNGHVFSFGDDWTTLNLGGRTYQLPNGTEIVNGVVAGYVESFGKKLKSVILADDPDVDPDYVNRPWHGYLSVNATNNSDAFEVKAVRRAGLQAGLVGNEPNALTKATGDRAATGVEMSDKTIDLGWLQDNLSLSTDYFSEQNGQLRTDTFLVAIGVYVPYVEKTVTRTINVAAPDGKTTAVKQTATLAKQVDFGKDAHPAWTTGEWVSYDVPTIPGYTASQSQIAKTAVTGTTEDQTVNITYTANDGTQTIVYRDDDGSEINKQVISGKTDEKVKVTTDVPDGYVVKGEVPSEVTIKPKDTPITVTVEHGKSHVTPDKPVNKGDLIPDTKDKHYPEGLTHNDLNKTVTREVTITDPTGKKTTTTQTVTFTRGATVDEVTNEVTYDDWSENGKHTFDKVDVPNVPGYTASSDVPSVVVTPENKSTTVKITYTANDGSQTIVYEDKNDGEAGKQVVPGKTDQTVKVTPEIPDGYVVTGEVPSEVTIKPKDTPIVVHVEHGKSHVTPDKPVNKGDLIPGTKDKHYPDGLTHDDLNKTVTRDVEITTPDGRKTSTHQEVTFTRGATVDEVTGKVTYGTWSEGGKHTFEKADVPTVPGYTASGNVPSVVVTPESKSSIVKITYTENGQKASENSSITDVTDQNDANVDENNNGHQISNDPTDDKSNDSNKDREKVKKTRKSGQLGLNNNSNSRLSKENKGFTKPDKDNFEQAKQEKQLPQAGESKDSLSIMGLVATALFGVFSFGLKKKKKE